MTAPRVLLLWPGSDGAAGGNFGVPQLVGLATYLRVNCRADVTVLDLECERALSPVDFAKLFEGQDRRADARGYDVVGLSCYSSFDYLGLFALAEIARVVLPHAVIVAGGYHVSARPEDFVFDGSPFDVAVIGEGEKPMAAVVASVAGGAPMRRRVLGPDPIHSLDELPETDWSFLARYRDIARKVASQAEIYLSRGCPFECAFCMESAKREVSWRGYSVDRAFAELRSLDRFLDLRGWTLYFADALFGMPKAWRRAFLTKLAETPLSTDKNWLLIRVDMVDDEDLRLFRDANCAPGFGLESGDPEMLATIRKAGRLHDYLDRMLDIGARACELQVPWGANVIVGHPGETEGSLRRSAAFMRKLFLEPKETTGFLSVDPFRFYPGSPIDHERASYAARHGTVIHRPEWWKDGDPAFLSEWVDPSRELSYARRDALMEETFAPILREAPSHFAYRGTSRPYFMRALKGQIEQFEAPTRLAYLERYYAWQKYTGHGAQARRERESDSRLASVCANARAEPIARVFDRLAGEPQVADETLASLRAALLETPRERHVPLDAILASTRDQAVALDRSGAATVSAFHAYARTFTLAGIGPGSRVLDLGAGTGYGTALLARLVGPSGRVKGVELDPRLVSEGRAALDGWLGPNVDLVCGSAFDESSWAGGPWDAVVLGFAIDDIPASFRVWAGEAVVVAPCGPLTAQRLVRARRVDGEWKDEILEPVHYVASRREVPQVAPPTLRASVALVAEAVRTQPVRLPLLRDGDWREG